MLRPFAHIFDPGDKVCVHCMIRAINFKSGIAAVCAEYLTGMLVSNVILLRSLRLTDYNRGNEKRDG